MALRAAILLLIQLTPFIYTVRSCNVSCTTDYETLLNCSCTDVVLSEHLQLQVHCRYDDQTLDSNCLLTAQQPFCVMYPHNMYLIADVETVCRASALHVKNKTIVIEDSPEWYLRNAVRPGPPLNIHVEASNNSYKITWHKGSLWPCLTFRVRIRPSPRTQEAVAIEKSTEPFIRLEGSQLLHEVLYTVDAQAKLCPGFRYQGPWSDWSAKTSWTTAAASASTKHAIAETTIYYWLILLPILVVLLSLALAKMMQKKMTMLPNPGEFFSPLYNKHQGNFKAWVMPAFSEHDFFKIGSAVDVRFNPWDISCFLHTSSPPYETPSQGEMHSIFPSRGSSGISIHTVTLSAEDHLSHCSVSLDYPLEAGCELYNLDGVSEKRRHLNLNSLNPKQELDEEELSGDGYPLMDLDTIDSGFGECSSPPGSGPNTEQLCELHQSNYVKQWTTSHFQGPL